MLPRSLRCLCLCLAVLITIFIDQSSGHQPFSRRGTPSFSAFSYHRFAHRSSPWLNNHLLQRRSIPSDQNSSPPTLHVDAVSHQGRSIPDDQSDDSYTPQSLDQERDQVDKSWEEFVESVDGEDFDSYPDCDDGQITSASRTASSPSNDSTTAQPLRTSSSPTFINETGIPTTSSDQQDQKPSKVKHKGSNFHEDNPQSGDEDKKAKESAIEKDNQHTQQAKEAEAKQKQKEQDAAKAKKEQEAAEATKEQETDEARKKKDAAKAKKEKEDAEAQKEQEEARNKKAQADVKAPEKAKKGKEAYRVTDLEKIPGTSAVTGTAHSVKDQTYNSTPSSDEHTGDATFFAPDLGACGITNTPSDYIVAVSHLLYDSYPSQGGNPNTNTICGKRIRATYKDHSVDVTVTDRCEGCDMYSLDFTETAFQKLGTKEEGRLHGMTWSFV